MPIAPRTLALAGTLVFLLEKPLAAQTTDTEPEEFTVRKAEPIDVPLLPFPELLTEEEPEQTPAPKPEVAGPTPAEPENADIAKFSASSSEEDPVKMAALVEAAHEQIFFSKSSSKLRSAEQEKLSSLTTALINTQHVCLLIEGKTDPYGDPSFNNRLRDQRSQAVAEQLIAGGVDPARLQIALPSDNEAKPKKRVSASLLRRVDFKIQGIAAEEIEIIVAKAEELANPEENEPAEHAENFTEISKRDSHLHVLQQQAATTRVYFEYSVSSVRAEYWRDLKALAAHILSTPDGAIAITGYASPRLPEKERALLARRRCTSVASRLTSLGVTSDRMLLIEEPGILPGGTPNWREHRVGFTAMRGLAVVQRPSALELAQASGSPSTVPRAMPVSLLAVDSVGIDDDPLTAAAYGSTVVFESDNATVKRIYSKTLLDVAQLMLAEGETRSISLHSFVHRTNNHRFDAYLSKRRQQSITDYLTGYGVPESRIREDPAPTIFTPKQTDSGDCRVELRLFQPALTESNQNR